MKVCTIIPALNEETGIRQVVAEIPRGLVHEVVVVDNGSTDGTARVAREAGARVIETPERGYGAACMTGVAAASEADVYVFVDGDGSDVPTRLPDLLTPVLSGEAVLALGVRAGNVEDGAMLWHQRLGNTFFVAMISVLSGRRLHDLPSFKVITAQALRSLDLRERTHGWTAELISKAALRRLLIVEVNTGYRRRLGKSKVSGTVRGSALAAMRIFSAIVRSWIAARCPSAATAGAVVGSLVGLMVLAVASLSLLSIDGTTYKVLVAVWLWALPVIGASTVAGYGVGRAMGRLLAVGKARD